MDGRPRGTVIEQIKEEFPVANGPHGLENCCITVAVSFGNDGRFLNEREIIIKSNQKNEDAKPKKKEVNFLDQLKRIVP